MAFLTYRKKRQIVNIKKNKKVNFEYLYWREREVFNHLIPQEIKTLKGVTVYWAIISDTQNRERTSVHIDEVHIIGKFENEYLVVFKKELPQTKTDKLISSLYLDITINKQMKKCAVGIQLKNHNTSTKTKEFRFTVPFHPNKKKMILHVLEEVKEIVVKNKIKSYNLYISDSHLFHFLTTSKRVESVDLGMENILMIKSEENEQARYLSRSLLDQKILEKKSFIPKYYGWVDASVKREETRLSAIIKNTNLDILFKHTKIITKSIDINQAELLALLELVEIIKKEKITNILVHTDSKTIVENLNDPSISMKKETFKKIMEAKLKINSIENIRIKWIPRRENKEADELTRNNEK